MKNKLENTTVYDNGGKTQDRYTIVLANGDVHGASEGPFHTGGIGTFGHNLIDSYWVTCFGHGWRTGRTPKQRRRMEEEAFANYHSQAQADPNWIGKKVKNEDLPADVRIFIESRL